LSASEYARLERWCADARLRTLSSYIRSRLFSSQRVADLSGRLYTAVRLADETRASAGGADRDVALTRLRDHLLALAREADGGGAAAAQAEGP